MLLVRKVLLVATMGMCPCCHKYCVHSAGTVRLPDMWLQGHSTQAATTEASGGCCHPDSVMEELLQ